MLTATGRALDLLNPHPDDLSVLDIAHHLAQTPRYNGAALRPCSVAEHSLLVAEIMERQHGVRSPSVLLCGLMHDAHEAYVGDITTPVKQTLGPYWAALERRLQVAVLRRWQLLTAYTASADLVRHADLVALSTERSQLMPQGGPEWPVLRSHPPVDWYSCRDRASLRWEEWRDLFIERFAELHAARQEQGEQIT